MRDAKTHKPLIFDLDDQTAKPFDTDIHRPGMEGKFVVSGIEIGADEDKWVHDNIEVTTSFQQLIEHMKEYTPEWAEEQSDVPAERIRTVADEFVSNACVGQTIEVEGEEMPFRPVAILLGKTVNNGWGDITVAGPAQCC
jgi:phenylacetyl-CoA:acceptor oxidoreductase